MIPRFDDRTGYLPKGVHPASWAEMETALGFSTQRRELISGLLQGCRAFRDAGAKVMFIDGSFATDLSRPKDYDCCYPGAGVDTTALDPVLLGVGSEAGRATMKDKYKGEFWPAEAPIHTLTHLGTIFTFFQRDKSDKYRGMIALDLSTLP